MARIDSFNSGFIVVDGKQYLHDVVILPDGSVTPREGGKGRLGSHVITWQDVARIDRERPDFVVIGTGAKGRAKLTVDAEMNLRQDTVIRGF